MPQSSFHRVRLSFAGGRNSFTRERMTLAQAEAKLAGLVRLYLGTGEAADLRLTKVTRGKKSSEKVLNVLRVNPPNEPEAAGALG